MERNPIPLGLQNDSHVLGSTKMGSGVALQGNKRPDLSPFCCLSAAHCTDFCSRGELCLRVGIETKALGHGWEPQPWDFLSGSAPHQLSLS